MSGLSRQPPPGAPGAKDPAAVSPSHALARLGLTVLIRLSAVIRIGRSYNPDNQVFVSQIESFVASFAEILEAQGEVVLVALDSDLYMNGTRIHVHGWRLRFHQHILEEFRRRQIAGIRILKGFTVDEMKIFFGLFMKPDVYVGEDLLRECTAQGTKNVLPAVYAASHDPNATAMHAFTPLLPVETNLEDEGEEPHPLLSDVAFEEQASGESRSRPPSGAATKTYSSAIAGARSVLMTTSLQGGMEVRHAKRVVQPLVDGAFADQPLVLGLSSLSHHDQYTYAHAVNVTLVAVTMGHFLELDRRALADLGVAALLHDVGKSVVASQIEHSFEALTPQEERLVERHPVEGLKLLASSTKLNNTTFRCMRVALEHHAGPDNSGFPSLGLDWRTSLLSRIVAIADCYVSLQMHRSARGSHVTPFEALGMMLGPLKSRFHPAMLWALVQTVGFYPPGQLVELDDGTVAAVLAPNAEDLARPHLRPAVAPDGRSYAPGEVPDFKPLPKERSVKRALRGAEYPADDSEQSAA